MKTANVLIVGLMAGAVTGCGAYNYTRDMVASKPGNSVEFVSGSPSSVLIDFNTNPTGEMSYADTMAKDKCAIFNRSSATLESLNPRGDNRTRATYLCK